MRSKVLFFLTTLVLVGCSKAVISDTPKIRVVINVLSPLSVTEDPQTRAGGDPSVFLSSIHYGIAKDNLLILSGTQSAGDSNFGKLELELEAGTYDFFTFGVGSSKSFTYTPTGIPTSNTIESKNSEVFANTEDMTITTHNNTIDRTISRVVGGLVFKITDVVPDAISKVEVSYSEKYTATGKALTVQSNKYDFSKTMTIANGKLEELSTFVLPQTLNPIIIRAYDLENNIVITKTVETLNVLANHRYTISGTLFEGFGKQDLSITVEEDWIGEEDVNL